MIKSLALNLLLALGSVAASQPQADKSGLSARTYTCGTLARKVMGQNKCVCTSSHATIDTAGKACSCDDGYKQSGNTCVYDCGPDADFKRSSITNRYMCQCKSSYLKYSNKACACEKDSQKDDGTACVDKCPGATYTVDGSSYKCVCDKTSQQWDDKALTCTDKCPMDITDYNDDPSADGGFTCTCKDTDYLFSGGKCDVKKCPIDGTKYTGDDDKGQPKCECTDTKKTLSGETCVLKCPVPDSDYTGNDDSKGNPICKCNDDSMKIVDSACVPKCQPDETFGGDGSGSSGPICTKKCPNDGTEFVKDGSKGPVCKCTDDSQIINDDLKCDLKCPNDGTEFVKDGETGPVCKCTDNSKTINTDLKCDLKCPNDGTEFVKDGETGPVCKCTDTTKIINTDLKCDLKCPNDGTEFVKDGEKGPVCKCTDNSKIINDDLKCDLKCTNPDTKFVKDGDDGQPPVCECSDAKKYLDGSNTCQDKCPAGAKYNDSGEDWTCDCPNKDEKFTKASGSNGPKCACDEDKQVVAGDNKCTSKCPTGATYTADETAKKGYTCDCSPVVAGSNWNDDKNTCDCPTTNGDGYTIKLNDKGDKCIIDCGTEATLSTGGDSCNCNLADGTKFDKTSLKCPCDAPDFKPFTVKKQNICIPDCGTSAKWNGKSGKDAACVCKKRGQTYTKDGKSCACDGKLVWSDGSCHKDCGKQADWDARRNDCVCEKRGQYFSDDTSTCSCPTEKPVWDGSRCVIDCGDYASYNHRAGVCVCDKKGKIFNASDKSCACPAPQQYINGKCQLDCGDDAGWDQRTNKCICYKSGQIFDKGTCACPADKPEWSSKLKCYKPKAAVKVVVKAD